MEGLGVGREMISKLAEEDVQEPSSVKFGWISAPNPVVPKYFENLTVLLQVADVPIAVVAWSGLRCRVLGLLAIARGVVHLMRRRLASKGEQAWATTGSLIVFGTLNWMLSRWRRSSATKGERLIQWTSYLLGYAQFATWSLSNLDTFLGFLVRFFYLLMMSLRVQLVERFRLQGTIFYAKETFPHRSSDITKEYVQKTLDQCDHFRGKCRITSIDVLPLSAGLDAKSSIDKPQGFIGETVRVKVQYESVKDEDNVHPPRSFVAKLPSSDWKIKFRLRTIGLYLREVRFYNETAPKMRAWDETNDEVMLKVPYTYGAEYDDRSSNFILLMEDAYPLGPGDETKGGSWQLACSVAMRYARFHSLHLSPTVDELNVNHGLRYHRCYGWMSGHPTVIGELIHRAFEKLMKQERFSRLVPTKTQRGIKLFLDHIQLVLEELSSSAVTLIHADTRVENMLLPSQVVFHEDKVCHAGLAFDDVMDRQNVPWLAVDWQTSCKGNPIHDLAYFVGLDLEVTKEAGTTCDRTLVTKYYQELERCFGGGPTSSDDGESQLSTFYSLEKCWRHYRLSMYLVSLIPIAVLQPESIGSGGFERCQRIRESNLRRIVRAIDRLESEEVLLSLLQDKLPIRYYSGQMTNYRLVEETILTTKKREKDDNNNDGDSDLSSSEFVDKDGAHGNNENGKETQGNDDEDEEEEGMYLVPRNALDKDESLTHHSPESLEKIANNFEANKSSGSVKDTYDRWFLNGYDQSGKYFFAAALGVYPGRRVVDASFSVVVDGIQHNVRASRHLTEEEWPTSANDHEKHKKDVRYVPNSSVGPIKICIVKPLEIVKLDVDIPGQVQASLTFQARFPAVMEPSYQMKVPKVGLFSYDRLTQLVKWDGQIIMNGTQWIEVVDWWGVRDRSWGIRPHPQADKSSSSNVRRNKLLGNGVIRDLLGPLLKNRSPSFYWFWVPINLPTGAITYHAQQSRDGHVDNGASHTFGDIFFGETKNNSSGGLFFQSKKQSPGDQDTSFIEHPPLGKVEAAGHSVEYRYGTRHAQESTIVMTLTDGRVVTVKCEPLFPFFMSGVGYGHPTFGHGIRHESDLVVQVDHFHTQVMDRNKPEYWHVQEVSKVTVTLHAKEASSGEQPIATTTGIAAVEQLVVGPHDPSQFTTLYDVAI